MLSHNDFPSVRDGSLIIHCISIVIEQRNDKGIRLEGHGVIKINSVGSIYLEFVCLKTENLPLSIWGNHFPDDPFDPTQKLYLSAITINNDTILGSAFSIKIRLLDRPPFITYVFFQEISFSDTAKSENEYENLLHFEIKERVSIPKNKINSVKSTLGSESHATNQTLLDWENIKLSIVNHDDHVSVTAKGNFNNDEMLEALTFYIGFTAGSMPQPYIVSKRNGLSKIVSIHSVRNSSRAKLIPAAICDRTIVDGKLPDESHFNLLYRIIKLKEINPNYFESIFAQWKRVWFGYGASREIRNLTLGVAVEGLLNDVYIPKFKKDIDITFESKKKEIIEKISNLDLDAAHIKTITESVGNWGNIHAPKALKILEQKGVVSKEEIKAHAKIRNSSAHPKSVEETIPRLIREHEHIGVCFTLLYGLMLNILGYEGSQFSYGAGFEAKFAWRPAIDVLGINEDCSKLELFNEARSS